MARRFARSRTSAAALALLLAACAAGLHYPNARAAAAERRAGDLSTRDLLDTYCVACHNPPPSELNRLLQQNALLNPQTTVPINDPIAGGVFVRMPPTETLNAQTTFHITPKWSANWGTMYDMVHNQFASNTVSLQRDLHDWRALFSFSQNPNGNFYFSFFIANKAQPDLKFNYDKPTYRQQDLR